MPAPIEFRFFCKAYGLADAAAGVMPLREVHPGGRGGLVRLWCPAVLQYRYRVRSLRAVEAGAGSDAASAVEWSPWMDIPTVRDSGAVSIDGLPGPFMGPDGPAQPDGA